MLWRGYPTSTLPTGGAHPRGHKGAATTDRVHQSIRGGGHTEPKAGLPNPELQGPGVNVQPRVWEKGRTRRADEAAAGAEARWHRALWAGGMCDLPPVGNGEPFQDGSRGRSGSPFVLVPFVLRYFFKPRVRITVFTYLNN